MRLGLGDGELFLALIALEVNWITWFDILYLISRIDTRHKTQCQLICTLNNYRQTSKGWLVVLKKEKDRERDCKTD